MSLIDLLYIRISFPLGVVNLFKTVAISLRLPALLFSRRIPTNCSRIFCGIQTAWTSGKRGKIQMKSFPLKSRKSKMIATRVCVASLHLQLAYPRRDAAARHLRTLGHLIATNSEVRKILSDFSVIGRDILARTASHAAESVRPEHDSLTKVDRPAPSDQFEASGSRQAGSSGTPEGQVHSTSQTADDAQHSEVTEVRAATEYVPFRSPSIDLTGLTAIRSMPTPKVIPKSPVLQVACRILRRVSSLRRKHLYSQNR